jgi:hypothetical protein
MWHVSEFGNKVIENEKRPPGTGSKDVTVPKNTMSIYPNRAQ